MGAILISDAEIAIQVASLGAEVARKRFGTSRRRIDKGGGDFASDADVEAEQAMLRFLQRERSDDEVLGLARQVGGTLAIAGRGR
jgi:myo-inositol-1(or 4)-monophosphatase